MALALAVAGLWGVEARAAKTDDASDARRHAQRASALAASGKCKQAVAEFDKALAVLRDPALLFNRGECHRKLGDTDEALEDYKQFLADLPKAPNRGEVERRIAELSRKQATGGAASADGDERPARPAAPAAREVPEKRPSSATGSASTRPTPAAAPAASSDSEPATPRPREVDLSPRSSDGSESAPAGVALASGSDSGAASSSDGGIATKPWFWIAVAVVAVGAGVGAYVLLSHDSTTVPSSALGNYKF